MNTFVINQNVIDTITDAEMQSVKGMKNAHLFQLLRELHDESIIEMYEEQFETHLARV